MKKFAQIENSSFLKSRLLFICDWFSFCYSNNNQNMPVAWFSGKRGITINYFTIWEY
jgi:hypothetical protein